jgi:hypothetical protein
VYQFEIFYYTILPQPAFGGTETLLIEAKEGNCCLLQVGRHFKRGQKLCFCGKKNRLQLCCERIFKLIHYREIGGR